MLDAALVSQYIQDAQKGLLPGIFDELRRADPGAQFDQQQVAEIAREMTFGFGVTARETADVLLVEYLALQVALYPADSIVQRWAGLLAGNAIRRNRKATHGLLSIAGRLTGCVQTGLESLQRERNSERVSLFAGSSFRKAGLKQIWQRCLNVRANQSNRIQVLNMHAILEAVAGELHANEVGDRSQQDALTGLYRRGGRNCFRVLRADFFIQENEVDCRTRLGLIRIDKHVNSTSMSIGPTRVASGLDDSREVLTRDRRANIGREACPKRIAFGNVNENSHAAHNAVRHSGFSQK